MKTIAMYADLLKASGLTQKDLAREMGISERTYSKWVHGNSKPTNSKAKAALAAAFAKYGKKPRAPRPIPPAGADATESEVEAVPDFDPDQLRRVQKASGLTVPQFIEKLGITTMSQYYRYTSGQQARKRSIRKVLYDACQTLDKLPEGLRFEQPPEGETEPQARSRGRSIVSEDLVRDSVERFEREELADFERDIVTKALRRTAQEYGYVPRQLREAIVIVFARVRGHVPISSLFTLLSGIDS